MTRVCAWCKQPFGEKCPRCGTLDTEKIVNSNRRRALFGCVVCKHFFREGEGGETHGVCPQCIEGIEDRRVR